MIKEDCMHYKEDTKKCNCLLRTYCKKERCNFYKTPVEDAKIKAKCKKRLRNLGWSKTMIEEYQGGKIDLSNM